MKHLVCFGFGYTARALARRVAGKGWKITGTVRNPSEAMAAGDARLVMFDGETAPCNLDVAAASHVLVSIPPDEAGDRVVRLLGDAIAEADLAWLGYLSTTGVYGDHGGGWVDETTPLNPMSERARRRVAAEQQWLDLKNRRGVPVHVFRLPGIYGPGRSQIDQLRAGTARIVDKPGHVFCRAHVDDIAGVLAASMDRPNPGAIYNVADDEPASSAEVMTYAAELCGVPAPAPVAFENADLSAMALSFYGECKRVANARIKCELDYRLQYPTYRDGLRAIAKSRSQA